MSHPRGEAAPGRCWEGRFLQRDEHCTSHVPCTPKGGSTHHGNTRYGAVYL